MEKKVKKQTQLELLTDIRDLLIPMSNVARYNIQKINEYEAQQQKEAQEKKDAKTSDDLNKDL